MEVPKIHGPQTKGIHLKEQKMAGLTLTKGNNLSLTKSVPGLNKVHIGLGWDPRTTTGDAFDLDASALLLGADGKVRSSADFIFYNQPSTADGAVMHKGDNRSGEGAGDDEAISVDLETLEADISRIEWKFKAFGQGYASGLAGVAGDFGVHLG